MNEKNFFHTNRKYSITLNPIDKYQYYGLPDRIQKFRNFMYDHLLVLTCQYEFYIEISEPRGMHIQGYNGPRLHLHGWLLFKTKSQLGSFLVNQYYMLLKISSVDIDTIDDEAKWLEYCQKQRLIKNNRLSSYMELKDELSVDTVSDDTIG